MDERELNDIVNILDGMVAQDISRISKHSIMGTT